MLSESKEESIQTNFTIWDNRFCTDGSLNILTLPIWSVFIQKSTQVMDSAFTVFFNPNKGTYEMYRDFQENTINSDGAFGMWFVVIAALYIGQ